MPSFQAILDCATQRKGGAERLQTLLPDSLSADQLREQSDAFYLAWMAKCIFRSGFVWRIIEQKWPGFEAVFHGFDVNALIGLDDEEWEDFIHDDRIVRHAQKIASVRRNAWFVHETSIQYGSFGEFLAQWPEDDLVGLFLHLRKHGSRLGGNTGQYFLQSVGKDSFALTGDVLACLRGAGVELAQNPTSKRDLLKIQDTFNEWHEETGLSYRHLSHIAAYSVGDNRVGVA